MATNEDIMFMLGEVKGELQHINKRSDMIHQKVDSIDKRVTGMQINAATSGGIAGTVSGMVVSLGIALITVKLKGG